MEDSHRADHDRIINMLDCSEKVVGLEMEVALMKERINEMKEDKDKGSKTLMIIASFVFTIVMAVAGFGIQSNANIQVLQEKVQEIKKEVEKTATYAHEH